MVSSLILACMVSWTDPNCTVLQFTAAWCEPCKQIEPSIQQLRAEGWRVQTVDVDRQRHLVEQFRIANLPTIIILSSNQEIDRMVGVTSLDMLRSRIQRVAARHSAPTGGLRNAGNSSVAAKSHPVGEQPAPIVRGQSPVAGGMLTPSLAAASGAIQSHLASQSGAATSSMLPDEQLTPAEAMQRAALATVRIRVDEANATAFGTGTVVDVHGTEALVLTCGHLFRDMQSGSQLSLDLFAGTPQETSVPAQLIDFDADRQDIGLLSFQLPVPIAPMRLLPRAMKPQIGQPVFSMGCDHGNDPTRRDTKISNINRYIGADNIEIHGAPAVGRSGGGLFDMQGRLIGVCNAADDQGDEGIYASAEVIYQQIAELGLSHLFEKQVRAAPERGSQPSVVTASGSRPIPPAANTNQWPDASGEFEAPALQAPAFEASGIQTAGQGLPGQAIAGTGPQMASTHASNAAQVAQVMCILRDAQGNSRMVTIDSPSSELIRHIEQSQ